MPNTPNSQAISIASQIGDLMQQIFSVRQSAAQINELWTNLNLGATFNAMATAPLLADGTQSQTNDGTPVVTNPISQTTYPALVYAIPANDLAVQNTFLEALVVFLDGGVPTQQGSAPQEIAKYIITLP